MMNRVLLWLWVALLSALCIGCGRNQGAEESKAPEYFAFRTPYEEGDGRWGIMDQEGRVIFKNRFDSEPRAISGNRFYVQHDGDSEEYYYQLYTLEPNPKVIGERYKDVTPFYEGVALVSRENKPISLIDTMGRVVVEALTYQGVPIDEAGEFRDGYAYVKQGDLYGFVNTKGEVHIAPQYVWATPFSGGYALVVEEKYRKALDAGAYDSIQILAIDDRGKQVGSFNYDQLFSAEKKGSDDDFFSGMQVAKNSFAYGKKVVYNDGAVGVVSIDGEMIVDYRTDWQDIELLGDKYIAFLSEGRWGVVTLEGKPLLRPQYNFVSYLTENRFAVSYTEGDRPLMHIVDETGDRLSSGYYSLLLGKLANGNALLWSDQVHALVRSSDGRELVSGSPLGGIDMPTDDWVCNRQIDIPRMLSFLNISDNGTDGKTLETTTKQIIEDYELNHHVAGVGNVIGFDHNYLNRQTFYTYYFAEPIHRQVGPNEIELVDMKPEAMCVELFVDTFLSYVPTQAQRAEITKQTFDLVANKGRALSRSADEVVVQTPSGLYMRAYRDFETENMCIVYAKSLDALRLPGDRL